jgi:hypothetical protein
MAMRSIMAVLIILAMIIQFIPSVNFPDRLLVSSSVIKQRLFLTFTKCPVTSSFALVLNVHRLGINGFLAGNALSSGEHAAIVVLVALHREAAFSLTSCPGQADIMFL